MNTPWTVEFNPEGPYWIIYDRLGNEIVVLQEEQEDIARFIVARINGS